MKYRLLWSGAVAGLAIHFLGLGWDVYRHSSDSTLAQRESVLALSNPSHLMIIAGMTIVAACLLGIAAVWMQERQFGGAGSMGTMLRSVSLPAIAVVAAGSVWLASTAEDQDDHHHAGEAVADHPHPEGEAAPEAVAAAVPEAQHAHAPEASANPAETSMGQANAHTHGTEVQVSAAQLLAAGKFVAELKADMAKYEDIRVAMADGYAQITPDLPGIAAHFIRGDYQHDGKELDPAHPEVLLYSKRLDGNWRMVGVMFLAENNTEAPPSYFGGLDSWHYHENLCFTAGAAVRTTASAAECRNGVFVKRTNWQMHVWTTGDETGIFAHDYPPISPGAFPGATRPAAEDVRVQSR